MPKVYKYTLIFDLRPKPLLNKTTVNISCGLLNEILTLFIFFYSVYYTLLCRIILKHRNYEKTKIHSYFYRGR